MDVGAIVVRCVDVEVWRAPDVVGQIGQDRRGAVAAPVSVPYVIHVGGPQQERASVESDAVASGPVTVGLTVSTGVIRMVLGEIPFPIRDDFLLIRRRDPCRPDAYQT